MDRSGWCSRTALSRPGPAGAEVTFWHGIRDEDYQQLLKSATALVTASSDEGFGLPIVEAMALGPPVVCSELPVFREVAADAAFFAPALPCRTPMPSPRFQPQPAV